MDPGTVRVGVAYSDPDGLLANPLETLSRDAEEQSDLLHLARLARDHRAITVYIGLPKTLAGTETASAVLARNYAQDLANILSGEATIRLVDERLTTVSATQILRASGIKARKQRRIVDRVAAVEILQHALDQEKSLGVAAGEQVAVTKA